MFKITTWNDIEFRPWEGDEESVNDGECRLLYVDWGAFNGSIKNISYVVIGKWEAGLDCWMSQEKGGEWSGPVKCVTHTAKV